MTQNMGRSLQDNNYQNGGFLDPRSTFLAKTDFRVDPLNQAKKRKNAANADGKKKRSLTFN